MKILDEKAVQKAVGRKQLDRRAVTLRSDLGVPPPKFQRVEVLLAEIAASMKSIATTSNSETALATATHAIQEVATLLQRYSAARPTHWTFDVQRDADGLIQSIEAHR